ncbi:MAG: FolB domain-containing protein [Sulfurovum sp.]|nr:FolB domain-containing protein [Sulfurovum sp.]
MTIHIEALTFNAIIGILDFEREHAQRVVIDLEIIYDYKKGSFIDYSTLCHMITTKIQGARYKLLEDALLELEILIITDFPQITSLYLKITKPDILKNATVALSQHWNY